MALHGIGTVALPPFPGVAGAAVHEDRALLVATCRGEGTVGLAALSDPAAITRLAVGPRPNGLAHASPRARTG